ncbi:MAG: hypothetical protein IH866_01055 [Chloroflexi bacterium]|nr:hypothetical protein [Chloroflexota bacterium]
MPAPADDEIVFTGEVPVEPGTTITLNAFTLIDAQLQACDDSLSFGGAGDRSGTSSFILVFEADCFQGADAALMCWDDGPPHRECSAVAFSPAVMEAYVQPERRDRVFSFERLGEVIDVGTLPIPPVGPDCILPPADVVTQHPTPPPPLPRALLLDGVVAAPNTIVYGGWAPVPPGSTVTLMTYETMQAVLEFEDCTETVTSAGVAMRDDVSEFLLVMPDTCLFENTGVVVCWGGGLSTERCVLRFPDVTNLGETHDVGELPSPPAPGAEGTCVLPAVGSGVAPDRGVRLSSSAWLALTALAIGIVLSGTGLAFGRRR